MIQFLILFAQMVIGIMKNFSERWTKAPKRRRNSWSRLETDAGNTGLVNQNMKLSFLFSPPQRPHSRSSGDQETNRGLERAKQRGAGGRPPRTVFLHFRFSSRFRLFAFFL